MKKTLIIYYTIKNYYLYLKLFESSLSANITKIHYFINLILIKFKSLLVKNSIN